MIGASIQSVSDVKRYKRETKHTVQVLASDRPLVGREQDSDNPAIPEHTDKLEGLAPTSQTPLGLGEPLGCTQQSTETDYSVSGSAGNTSCRDKGSESHVGRKDGAGYQGGDTPDDNDCVTGLAIVDTRDPAREGKHTVTGDGEHKTGSGDNCDRSVLIKG
jgi:hypothetical protein